MSEPIGRGNKMRRKKINVFPNPKNFKLLIRDNSIGSNKRAKAVAALEFKLNIL